jgi:hypothetical protein
LAEAERPFQGDKDTLLCHAVSISLGMLAAEEFLAILRMTFLAVRVGGNKIEILQLNLLIQRENLQWDN